MLAAIAPGQPHFSRSALIDAIVPRSIARSQPMVLPAASSEAQALAELQRHRGEQPGAEEFHRPGLSRHPSRRA